MVFGCQQSAYDTDTNRYTASAGITELVEAGGALFVDATGQFGTDRGILARVDPRFPRIRGNEFSHAPPRSIINVGNRLLLLRPRNLQEQRCQKRSVYFGAAIPSEFTYGPASELTNVNGTVYFSATDSRELWRITTLQAMPNGSPVLQLQLRGHSPTSVASFISLPLKTVVRKFGHWMLRGNRYNTPTSHSLSQR